MVLGVLWGVNATMAEADWHEGEQRGGHAVMHETVLQLHLPGYGWLCIPPASRLVWRPYPAEE